MKIIRLNLLEESKQSAKKYISDKNTLESIASKDPSKNFKYTELMAKFYSQKSNIEGILSSINVLYNLDKKNMLKKVDINKFNTLEELDDWLLDYNKQSKSKIDKEIKLKDAEKIYEDDNVLIIAPLTHNAARLYGSGTRWCIAEKTPKHWNTYNKKVKFYFILSKVLPESNPLYKVAIAVYPNGNKEVYNAEDTEINIDRLNLSDDILNLLKPKEFSIFDYMEGSYDIDSDGYMNVKGLVNISNLNLNNIPIKFGIVTGDFNCSYNNLTSLQGALREVGRSFYCGFNKLTSLQGAPEKVGGNFYCSNNNLTSLKGASEKVGGNFYCNANKLTSLEGAPEKVGGHFYCYANKLTSLQGGPKEVGGDFYCHDNKLTSLQGAPKEVGGDFYCGDNKLTSLKGAPEKIRLELHSDLYTGKWPPPKDLWKKLGLK